MKKITLGPASIIFLGLYFLSSLAFSAPDLSKIPKFAPDTVLVGFKPGTPGAEKSALHSQMGGKVKKTLHAIGVDVVTVPVGSVLANVEKYKKNSNVKFAEPDFFRLLKLPKEGSELSPVGDYFAQQWGLNNIAQPLYDPATGGTYSGVADADIDAPEGWNITEGDPNVVIAILDSGVDCSSVDLLGKCIDQKSFNSVELDFIDRVPHGTHVAGIAAANTNFTPSGGAGVAGIAVLPKIANLKVCYQYLYPDGFPLYSLGVCPVSASVDAILYAANLVQNSLNKRYHVINMSYGSDCDQNNDRDSADSQDKDATGLPLPSTLTGCGSEAEATAIDAAWAAGVVIVAAAGNDYGIAPHYPAAYDNVIAVASTDWFDNLSSFSTFGNTWVDVAAPGSNIFSVVPDQVCIDLFSLFGGSYDWATGCQDWYSGTSMASPHVAGVAAMVWSQLGEGAATNRQVRDCVENSANTTGALGQNFKAWVQHGRVNLKDALNCVSTPAKPSMHINAINVSTQNVGAGSKKGRAEVFIVDQNGAVVSEAQVTGIFSGGYSESVSSATTSSGSVVFLTNGTKKGGVTFTFCVSDVGLTNYTYNTGANVPASACATF